MSEIAKDDKKLSSELNEAIKKNDIDDIEQLFESGAKISNNAVIDEIARKKNCVSLLKLVEKYGYDLTQRGHIVLFQSAMSKKIKNVQFLLQKVTEKDTRVVKLSLVNLTSAYLVDKEKVEPIVDLLVPHITEEGLNYTLDNLKTNKAAKDYLTYVTQSWLKANLETNEVRSKRIKI